MKKYLFLFVALLMTMTSAAQSLRFALVKDEGGFTNVRRGPGTQYAIAEKIPDGMFFNCGAKKNGWYEVYTTYTEGSRQDFIGYISATKVVFPRRTGEMKTVAMVKQEEGYTNLRKGPGTSYPIVGKVKDGSYVLIGPSYDSWIRVYNQQMQLRGYMSANKLLPMESPGF